MTQKFLSVSHMMILLATAFLPALAQSAPNTAEPGRYALMIYHGAMTTNNLKHVLVFDYTFDHEYLYSVEGSYVFKPDQGIRRYFGPLFQSIEANINITYHDDHGMSSCELVPYLSFRWKKFPWTNHILTSISLGEGVSWISRISRREYHNSTDPQKILNYLNFEITASLATFPQLELVGRFHHRSGVFGLYRANNSGSTAVGLGLRWYFDVVAT